MKSISLVIFATFIFQILTSAIRVDTERHLFIDDQNREVYFHGINVVYKIPPWIPPVDKFNPLTSFSSEDIQFLKDIGHNIIRLGVQWPGVEPNRGEYNSTYLDVVKSIVENSKTNNIFTLLDFHQDILSEKFCGEGIPKWAVKPAYLTAPFPLPVQLSSFPLDDEDVPSKADCDKNLWPTYHAAMKTASSYQSLYSNVDGIQDAFGAFWRKVADTFKDEDYVIGYELINEPFAGDFYRNPFLMVPSVADRWNLQPMYDNLNNYIRQVDPNHIIFFESVTWDDFVPVGFSHVPGGDGFRDRSALSYHYYSQVNFYKEWQFTARMKDIKRLKTGGMLTEFAICDIGESIQVFEIADRYLQSWIGWSYKPFGDITGDCGGIYNADGSKNMERVRSLSRTYPQAVAGRTKNYSFDNNSSIFELEYEICESCGETEIYFNQDLRYTTGFNLQFNNESLVNWDIKEKNKIHISHLQGSDKQSLKLTLSPQ